MHDLAIHAWNFISQLVGCVGWESISRWTLPCLTHFSLLSLCWFFFFFPLFLISWSINQVIDTFLLLQMSTSGNKSQLGCNIPFFRLWILFSQILPLHTNINALSSIFRNRRMYKTINCSIKNSTYYHNIEIFSITVV